MNEFTERYKKWGWEYREIKPYQALRINPLRIDEKSLLKRLEDKKIRIEKSRLGSHSYTVKESDFSIGATFEYLLGYYYVQDPASQFAVELLNPQEGEIVLDMCAAPGGKTTYISQIMNNTGSVWAIDFDKRRCVSLKNNLERCRCANVTVFNCNAIDFPEQEVDRVLLDAPCSGNFCLEEGWFEKRSIRDIRIKAIMQRKLLEKAFRMTRRGGTIVYSTCSLEKEENENNSEWFASNFDVKKIEEHRFWPTEENIGFYCAKFIK